MTCTRCTGASDGAKLSHRRRQQRRGARSPEAAMKKPTTTAACGGGEEDYMLLDCHGRQYELVDYEKLPEYMRENEYIRRYYRAEWPLKHALLSLFRWHNETMNVWTHLVGFFVFLGLTAIHLRDEPVIASLLNNLSFNWPITMSAAENVSKDARNIYGGAALLTIPASGTAATTELGDAPRWPLMVFMCGSMFCLLCSSVCHLFCCHSQHLSLFLWRMDYVGIAIMIVTSFFPPIYYIFLCQPLWQMLYLSAISVMGIFTAATLLSPRFSTGPFRTYRALLFLAMGFSGIVPAIHALIINWDEPQRPITLAYELAMALLYVIGTVFYVSRVPERWKPGLFDLMGHSHQIFHAFVMAGALAHYAAALVLLEWRDRVHGCAMSILDA